MRFSEGTYGLAPNPAFGRTIQRSREDMVDNGIALLSKRPMTPVGADAMAGPAHPPAAQHAAGMVILRARNGHLCLVPIQLGYPYACNRTNPSYLKYSHGYNLLAKWVDLPTPAGLLSIPCIGRRPEKTFGPQCIPDMHGAPDALLPNLQKTP